MAVFVLISKRTNASNIQDFVPISILGTLYKIIAKVLAPCLCPIMSSFTTLFKLPLPLVEGCMMEDNEVVHSICTSHSPSFIIKLDIAKVFDSASWDFVFASVFSNGLVFNQIFVVGFLA